MKKPNKQFINLATISKLTSDMVSAKKVDIKETKYADRKGKFHSKYIINCMDIDNPMHWLKEIDK